MVSPLVVVVPVVGAAALYLLWPKKAAAATTYTPAPSTGPALVSGGPRAAGYQQQITVALLAYRTAKLFGGSGVSDAAKALVGTIDVVAGMTAVDVSNKTITPQDKASIDAALAAAKKEVTG